MNSTEQTLRDLDPGHTISKGFDGDWFVFTDKSGHGALLGHGATREAAIEAAIEECLKYARRAAR
jgi:hypothetical protein